MSKINRHGIAMPIRKGLLALVIFFSIQTRASNITEGEWVGGSDLFESPAYIHLDLGTGSNAFINIPQWKIVKRPLQHLKLDGDQIYFEIYSTTGVPFVAEGILANGVIEGKISRGDKKGKFHLILIKKISSDVLSKYVGCYQIPDPANKGVLIPHLITYSSNGHLRFVNLANGSTSPMLPMSSNKFFFAGSIITSSVPNATLSFIVDKKGNADKFVVQIGEKPEMPGTKVSTYKVEEIKAPSYGHVLAGTLLLPANNKKHPVVIVVPGSQALSRDDNTPYEEINTFVSNGFGLLIYDKQGTGQSGGDWRNASYEQLAEDVLAIVERLKTRNDIDITKIGAWGFSQGASIAPLAASMSKDISYLIMQSGGGITPAESEINQQVARMQVDKLSDTAIKDAIDLMKLQFRAVNDDQQYELLQARIAQAKTKPWLKYAFGTLPRDNWLWKWWKPVVDHNPAPILEKLKIPVLVIFGTKDPLIPRDSLDGMISRITDAFKKGGNNSVTLAKFEGANHEIFVQNEKKEFRLADGYDETLKNFILKIRSAAIRRN